MATIDGSTLAATVDTPSELPSLLPVEVVVVFNLLAGVAVLSTAALPMK